MYRIEIIVGLFNKKLQVTLNKEWTTNNFYINFKIFIKKLSKPKDRINIQSFICDVLKLRNFKKLLTKYWIVYQFKFFTKHT